MDDDVEVVERNLCEREELGRIDDDRKECLYAKLGRPGNLMG